MSSRIEEQLRADLVEAGRRMYARGYVASNDGTIRARLDEKRLMTTPKSVSKGFMTPDMMVIVDYEGNKIGGDREASSELPMHLEIYRNRPDVNGVVHAHPPMATGFAVAGIPLTRAVLAEVVTTLGSIPIAEYATPSTQELPDAVRKYIRAHDGMLLANHGALTVGSDLFSAYYKMETIEHFAKISLVARLLGRENLIAREEVLRLQELRGSYGIQAPAPICADETTAAPEDPAACQVVQAPPGGGSRLVPDAISRSSPPSLPRQEAPGRYGVTPAADPPSRAAETAARFGGAGAGGGEIRLTYRELSELIEDAIRNLR